MIINLINEPNEHKSVQDKLASEKRPIITIIIRKLGVCSHLLSTQILCLVVMFSVVPGVLLSEIEFPKRIFSLIIDKKRGHLMNQELLRPRPAAR